MHTCKVVVSVSRLTDYSEHVTRQSATALHVSGTSQYACRHVMCTVDVYHISLCMLTGWHIIVCFGWLIIK